MRFHFQKQRHLTLDIATGDILAERGDVLITGRISPASPLSALVTGRPHEAMQKLLLNPTRHFHCEEAAWRHVFAIQWTARARCTPDSPSYYSPILGFQQIVHRLSSTGLLAGNVRIGMTPLSSRAPHLTARIMRECLSHLFFAVRNFPRGNTSMHVSVRSLTEFRELTELLTRDLPVRYGPLGFPLTPWIPDDGEVRELADTVGRTLS
jgi:hypothetical protein